MTTITWITAVASLVAVLLNIQRQEHIKIGMSLLQLVQGRTDSMPRARQALGSFISKPIGPVATIQLLVKNLQSCATLAFWKQQCIDINLRLGVFELLPQFIQLPGSFGQPVR